MNLINKRLKKRGSSKFLRRKLAVSLNDADFQKYFDVPDFNQQYQFGLSLLDEDDYDNWENDCDKIYDYLHDMSSNEERLKALIDLGVYNDDEDEIDLENDYFWDDGEFIAEDILPALAERLHNNTLPAIWKGLIPKLTKAYYAPDSQYNCNVTESDFKELKRCWEKVPAIVDEMLQYIKDNNITYENWNDMVDSIQKVSDPKIAAISSSDIWDYYFSTVSSDLIYYLRMYLDNLHFKQ